MSLWYSAATIATRTPADDFEWRVDVSDADAAAAGALNGLLITKLRLPPFIVTLGTLNIFLAFGTMPSQAEIDANPALIDGVIAANYSGAVNLLHRAAPLFEQQKVGAIVVLTSVAGDRGRLKNYVYGSTKGALGAYLQGLRARLFRAGVSVVTVKPGPVDTAMSYGLTDMPLMAQPVSVCHQ